jgi:hypothetical protein
MKSGVVFLIIFVLICAAGIWTQAYLNKSSESLNDRALILIDEVTSESWEQAAETVSVLYDQWERDKKVWLVLVEHEKIDLIDEAVHEAQMMVDIQEKPHSMEALGQFTFHVQDVPHKGRLGIANIF